MSGECWLYATCQGEFRIEPMRLAGTACFAVLWEDELLGCYETPAVAASNLSRNLVHKPRCGLDLRRLGLPPTLTDWAYVPAGSGSYRTDAQGKDGARPGA